MDVDYSDLDEAMDVDEFFNDEEIFDDNSQSNAGQETTVRNGRPDVIKATPPDTYEIVDDEVINNDNNNSSDEDIDFVDRILNSKGFNGRSLVIENEHGQAETVDFDDLSELQKAAILGFNPNEGNDEEGITEISEEDLNLLNYVKANNVIERLAEEEAEDDSDLESAVDDFSDEQLYAAHLSEIYPNLTEDEIIVKLETEMEDETTFSKITSDLRDYYKEKEDLIREENDREEFEAYRQELIESNSTLNDEIMGMRNVNEYIELEENDMEDLYDFISVDEDGVSEFDLALKDPKNLIKAALYLRNGDDFIRELGGVNQELNKRINNNNNRYANRQEPSNSYFVSPNRKRANRDMSMNDLDSLVVD